MIRLKGPKSVEMMQVIKVTAEKGTGIEGDPVREIIQYWDTEGNLLAETDTPLTYVIWLNGSRLDLRRLLRNREG